LVRKSHNADEGDQALGSGGSKTGEKVKVKKKFKTGNHLSMRFGRPWWAVFARKEVLRNRVTKRGREQGWTCGAQEADTAEC